MKGTTICFPQLMKVKLILMHCMYNSMSVLYFENTPGAEFNFLLDVVLLISACLLDLSLSNLNVQVHL